jgi:hypothetical protein
MIGNYRFEGPCSYQLQGEMETGLQKIIPNMILVFGAVIAQSV